LIKRHYSRIPFTEAEPVLRIVTVRVAAELPADTNTFDMLLATLSPRPPAAPWAVTEMAVPAAGVTVDPAYEIRALAGEVVAEAVTAIEPTQVRPAGMVIRVAADPDVRVAARMLVGAGVVG
jgi:hypothetical protein